MKKSIDAILVLAFFACAVSARAAAPIRVMLLDGEQAGAYHNWQETSPYLLKMLAEPGIFQVDRVTAPPAGLEARLEGASQHPLRVTTT